MSIAKSLRDNAALVAGIVLPVIVVILFLLSSWIPKLLVDPPQYDVLYFDAGYYGGNPSPWRYEVTLDSQNHLQVKAFFVAGTGAYSPGARLFLFDHRNGNVREIALPTPKNVEGGEAGIIVEVPDFRNRYIDPSRVSPDGYALVDNTHNSLGLFSLFYSGNRRGLAISKNGAVFEAADGSGQYSYGSRLIGWLVPPPQQ